MSINKKLSNIAIWLCLVISVTSGYSYFGHSASTKEPLFKQIVKTKKLQAPSEVKMHLLEEGDVQANQVYTLEATIKAPKTFSNSRWEWNAPPEVVLLDRESGDGLQLIANEEIKLSVRFRQIDNENHRIKLLIKDSSTGVVLGRTMYNTTRERTIAQENKEMLERQELYLEENPEAIKSGQKAHSH